MAIGLADNRQNPVSNRHRILVRRDGGTIGMMTPEEV